MFIGTSLATTSSAGRPLKETKLDFYHDTEPPSSHLAIGQWLLLQQVRISLSSDVHMSNGTFHAWAGVNQGRGLLRHPVSLHITGDRGDSMMRTTTMMRMTASLLRCKQ